MSYFHCGNGYPDRCNGYKGPLDASVCTSGRHKYDESGRQIADETRCRTCGHSTAPIWFGQPGSGDHSEDDGSCIACGPELGKRCAR